MLWLILTATLSLAQDEWTPEQDCGARVERDRFVLDPRPIAFPSGKATPTPASRDALAALACALELNPDVNLRIEVHTDNVGNAAANRDLSQARADAIRDALIALRVDAARIHTKGHGPDQPIASNSSASGRASNRRVELVALPPGQGLRAADKLVASLPPPDADGDGIPDSRDQCPFEAEDYDGYQDDDGCPDLDNDGDGIPDHLDKCANEPETFNGYQDEDGCPDVAPGPIAAKPQPPATKPQPVAATVERPPAVSQLPPVIAEPARPARTPLPSIDDPLRTGRSVQGESAVVIGLERYMRIPGVPHASRDAAAFYDYLVYTRGVPGQKAQLLTQGSKDHMIEALERAAAEAGRGGKVWVYFAGHGAGHPSSKQRLLLGDDFTPDGIGFNSRGLPVNEVERIITSAGATPILILDTCYAGVGRSGESIAGGTRFVVPDYALTAPTGGAQWTAAGPNQLSGPLEGVDHGAFTYFAIGALRGWADGEIDGQRDGKVTAAEANAYVARALRRVGMAKQQPSWAGADDLVLAEGVREKGPF